MKILLPVDGSKYTRRMLAYLGAHDEFLAAEHDYVAFTAVAPVPANASRFVDDGILAGYYRDHAEKVLKTVRAFAEQHRWRLRTAYGHGHAAETIAVFAHKEKPDLIVMGTHGHSALGNMVLGSVATGVIARSKFPVLLVP